MHYLEQHDARDRQDGTPFLQRLRQIPPETGKFLALLAVGAPAGEMLEIGTSAGYSTLWLSLACKTLNRSITTFELLPEKIKLARQTFQAAQVEDRIKLVEGNVLETLAQHADIGFCFLDTDRKIAGQCYETIVPRLVTGGLLAVDNVISHQEELQPVIDRALEDDRVDALVVPVGKGVLLCRKA
jgi:predicted O-methyltransferase YrrM